MALTTNQFTYAGGAQTFTLSLSLDYDETSDIEAYVVGNVDGEGAQIFNTFTFDSEFVIRITETLAVDDEVVVQRTVSSTVQKVNFETGGDVTPRNLQLQYRHIFSLLQEVLDGRGDLLQGIPGPTGPTGATGPDGDLTSVAGDATPELGGDLDLLTHSIVDSVGDMTLDPTGNLDLLTGSVRIQRFLAHSGDTDTYLEFANALNEIILIAGAAEGLSVNASGVQFGNTGNRITSIATLTQWLNNTVDMLLDVETVWAGGAEVTLTDDTTIAVDMDTFINAKVTLTDNRTLGNPTNEKVGQSGFIRVIQDAGGTNTLAFGTDWEFAGGAAPTISTGADDENILHYVVLAADRILISATLDID